MKTDCTVMSMERTVPYYACEHGTPGGCNWCRALAIATDAPTREERDHLRAQVAELRAALQAVLALDTDTGIATGRPLAIVIEQTRAALAKVPK